MKPRILLVIIIGIVIVSAVFFTARKNEPPEKYLSRTSEEVAEILYCENISDGKTIIFFLDDDGYVWCAVLKKGWFGYQTLRISGKMNAINQGYLCSHFEDDGTKYWIDWGLITDKEIKTVKADSKDMMIVQAGQYNYRICWIMGHGAEPKNHTEGRTTKVVLPSAVSVRNICNGAHNRPLLISVRKRKAPRGCFVARSNADRTVNFGVGMNIF